MISATLLVLRYVLEFKMEMEENISVLSEYAKNVEGHVKERYVQKLAVIGVDPASLPSEQFDSENLPPIESTDLLSYLVLETSYHAKELRSRHSKVQEAFKQMAPDL